MSLLRLGETLSAICLVLIVLLLPAATSHAAFIGEKDSFTGTALDLQTWEAYKAYQRESIAQNDGLTLDGPPPGGGAIDYTTRAVSVGIGQGVRAGVQLLRMGNSGGIPSYFGLYLTDNSRGSTWATPFDSRYIGFFASSDLVVGQWGSDAAGGMGAVRYSTSFLGVPQFWQIDRLSRTNTRYSIYNAAGLLLWEDSYSIDWSGWTAPKDYPDRMFISLWAMGDLTVRFTDVTLLGVPEPTAIGFLFLCAFPALTFRRRRPDPRCA
jgi:hypothetical protein